PLCRTVWLSEACDLPIKTAENLPACDLSPLTFALTADQPSSVPVSNPPLTIKLLIAKIVSSFLKSRLDTVLTNIDLTIFYVCKRSLIRKIIYNICTFPEDRDNNLA